MRIQQEQVTCLQLPSKWETVWTGSWIPAKGLLHSSLHPSSLKSRPNAIRRTERFSKGEALGGKLRGKTRVLPTLRQVTQDRKVRLRPRGEGTTAL
jgi:hypothetical protein